jgi:hypothetical protein
MRVEGDKEMLANLEKLKVRNIDAAKAALFAEAANIIADSKENYVPVDTGNLRKSAHTEKPNGLAKQSASNSVTAARLHLMRQRCMRTRVPGKRAVLHQRAGNIKPGQKRAAGSIWNSRLKKPLPAWLKGLQRG